MSVFKPAPLLLGIALLFLLVKPAHAFGAGNIAGISKVEGQNCESPKTPICTQSIRSEHRLMFFCESRAPWRH